MMYGYGGKILRVDLFRGKAAGEDLDPAVAKRFIGGKGLGAYIMHRETEPGMDPLSPESKMVMAAGPMEGTFLPGSGRFAVVFKSPMSGGLGESHIGGHLGPSLKFAGYDAIVLEGASDKPVYITIDDDRVEIRDASFLWGLDSYRTEELLTSKLGQQFRILSIGQAGENVVKYATLNHSLGRQAGRRGVGAIVGSKKLKAIAIRGTKGLKLAKPKELTEYYLKNREAWMNTNAGLSKFGTTGMVDTINNVGALPTKNWMDAHFDKASSINHVQFKERLAVKDRACTGCHVACNKLSMVNQGPYAGLLIEGPEYETLFSLGSLLELDDIEAVAKLNEVADRMGIDTISLGNNIAFATECFEKEIISIEDTDGIELRFGQPAGMIQLAEKIARREGIGDILAEGTAVASQRIGQGSEDFTVTFKGVEPPAYDPRGLKGCGLSLAVATKGACHLQAVAHRAQLTGAIDRFGTEGQAANVKKFEDLYAFRDSFIACTFVVLPPDLGPLLWDELSQIYRFITGNEMAPEDVSAIGERIYTMSKLFNLREGLTSKDDKRLPKRLTEPVKTGPTAGKFISEEDLSIMVDDYYKLREWDANGIPTAGKLKKLGIQEFAAS